MIKSRRMWEIVEHGDDNAVGLLEMATWNEVGAAKYLRLYAAIIIQGGKDRDLAFFKGQSYHNLCTVCGLDPVYVLSLIEAIWAVEDKEGINANNL